MKISSIKVQNFKTFKDLSLCLNDFNILIGANASGKSSFIQLFKFIKDIKLQGLENAISLQGGIEYLRNINLGSSMPFSVELTTNNVKTYLSSTIENNFHARIDNFTYGFTLGFTKRRRTYKIIQDHAEFKLTFYPDIEKGKSNSSRYDLLTGTINIRNDLGKIVTEVDIPDEVKLRIYPNRYPLMMFAEKGFKLNKLFIDTPYFLFPLLDENIFSNINFYDIDPKLPKRAVPLSGKAELEYDGSNLAIVLRNILKDPDKKNRLSQLISDILPFVTNLSVESLADKSFIFNVQENYSLNQYLPASLLSDGTIGITALLVALYFDKNPDFSIIEEPERNLHPSLISKLINIMKDISKSKQILITTHNLEVIKNTDISDILLINRCREGFSTIQRPSELSHIKIFLEQELGIEDLFLQNLLS